MYDANAILDERIQNLAIEMREVEDRNKDYFDAKMDAQMDNFKSCSITTSHHHLQDAAQVHILPSGHPDQVHTGLDEKSPPRRPRAHSSSGS